MSLSVKWEKRLTGISPGQNRLVMQYTRPFHTYPDT